MLSGVLGVVPLVWFTLYAVMMHSFSPFLPWRIVHVNWPYLSDPLLRCLPAELPFTIWITPPGRYPLFFRWDDANDVTSFPNCCLSAALTAILRSSFHAQFVSAIPIMPSFILSCCFDYFICRVDAAVDTVGVLKPNAFMSVKDRLCDIVSKWS